MECVCIPNFVCQHFIHCVITSQTVYAFIIVPKWSNFKIVLKKCVTFDYVKKLYVNKSEDGGIDHQNW